MSTPILIATLGSEPQVVTLTLDLLQAQGVPIAEVRIVHTFGQVVREALAVLEEEFRRMGEPPLRPVPIFGAGERPVFDVRDREDLAALFRTLYRTVREAKAQGRTVHLSVAGGRKTMAVYGMAVAQLLFDEGDRVWHLLSEGWTPGSPRILHVEPGDPRVQLVPVPVLRWSTLAPAVSELVRYDDPWEAIEAQRRLQQRQARQRQREFVEGWLTPAEREVIRLLCEGYDNRTIARRLGRSPKTVANQLTRIYRKFQDWYGGDVPVSRAAVAVALRGYFEAQT